MSLMSFNGVAPLSNGLIYWVPVLFLLKVHLIKSHLSPILTSLLEHCEVLPLGLCIGCRYQASSDENEQHV